MADRNVCYSTVEVNMDRMYGLSASDILEHEDHIKRKLISEFTKFLYGKATITSTNNPNHYSKTFTAQVVILSLKEYTDLMSMASRSSVTYPSTKPMVMEEVEEEAKKVLQREIQKSKTAEDYLMNRVRQLQNEHLLPKRKSN